MAEYIERKSLIDEFDRLGLGDHSFVERVFSDGVRTIIAGIPAADVVPVVHCRRCRSYNKPRLGWCSVHLDREGPDDFCGYGVRMDGDSDALD